MSNGEFAEIGKYRILGQIGEGAMGVVYRALDLVLNRPVAIKVMNDSVARDTELRARFLREAQSAGSLQHPNVVTIYDFGEVNGHLFIAMELVEGIDLIQILLEKRPLSVVQKIDVLIDVLNGLAYAHKRGIVHRDVKPANIRIDDEGRARIMDFGIAHLASSTMTRTGTTVGTPSYMSPEQIAGGAISASSDIFSAGAVMYEVFTGVQAFQGASLQNVMYQIISAPPPPFVLNDAALPADQRASLSESLGEIVNRALAKEPSARFGSALDMAAALSAVRARVLIGHDVVGPASLRATVATALATRASTLRSARRARIGGIVIGGVVVVIASLIAVKFVGQSTRAHVDAPAATTAETSTTAVAQRPAPVAATIAAPAASNSRSAGTPPREAKSERRASVAAPAPAPASRNTPVFDTLKATALDARAAPVVVAASPVVQPPKAQAAESAIRPLPPPPPKASATEPAAAPVVPPSAGVDAAVAAYARAIESRDVDAVRRAFPGLTAREETGWKQFFASVQSLRVTFATSGLEIDGLTAEAKVAGRYDFVNNSGKAEQRPVSFLVSLRRQGTAWFITAVR